MSQMTNDGNEQQFQETYQIQEGEFNQDQQN